MNADIKDNGIPIDLLKENQMENMAKNEKVGYIIDRVKDGHIVILESGLTPEEESVLVERTMSKINPDEGFEGIDIESHPEPIRDSRGGIFDRLLNRGNKESSSITVMGPASQMETIHKDNNKITAILSNK